MREEGNSPRHGGLNYLDYFITMLFCSFVSSVDVDPDLDPDSQDYLEALVQATEELEFCVNLCKSRVMMETCFDVLAPTSPGQELEV